MCELAGSKTLMRDNGVGVGIEDWTLKAIYEQTDSRSTSRPRPQPAEPRE